MQMVRNAKHAILLVVPVRQAIFTVDLDAIRHTISNPPLESQPEILDSIWNQMPASLVTATEQHALQGIVTNASPVNLATIWITCHVWFPVLLANMVTRHEIAEKIATRVVFCERNLDLVKPTEYPALPKMQ